MPFAKGKLARNSTSLGKSGKMLTICHVDPGPDMKEEVK